MKKVEVWDSDNKGDGMLSGTALAEDGKLVLTPALKKFLELGVGGCYCAGENNSVYRAKNPGKQKKRCC